MFLISGGTIKSLHRKEVLCLQQHYFLGIRIPSDVQPLAEKYMELHMLPDRYKVVTHQDDLHITLFYLGACDERKISKLVTKLRSVAAEHQPFSIQVDGFNFFGPSTGPRVTYLSVTKNLMLDRLQKSISDAVKSVTGLPSSDRFVPHITIAKKRKTDERLDLSPDLFNPHTIQVDHFHLFAIHPQQLPKYKPIASFQFGHDC